MLQARRPLTENRWFFGGRWFTVKWNDVENWMEGATVQPFRDEDSNHINYLELLLELTFSPSSVIRVVFTDLS